MARSSVGAAAGPHGGDGLALARSLGIDPSQVLDLSASLNPFAPDVAEVVARHLGTLGNYPDPTPSTEVLAATIGVDADRVLLTNGGAEAIMLVAAELPDGDVRGPEFSLYARHLRSVADGAPRWRSNPNNPLGVLADANEQAMVWDEAFLPMVTGRWTRGDDAAWRLGSLTKLWACPGLRLGFVIAPDADAASRLAARQPRWSVNGLALGALPDLLRSTDLADQANRLADHRASFSGAVEGVGFTVRPGVAPWLLVESRADLRSAMARTGIVVRDCANFGLPGVFRIALPHPVDVDRVLTALGGAGRAPGDIDR